LNFSLQNYPAPNLNFVNRTQSKKVNVQDDHYQLIREIGASSIVLLKNTNKILPLKTNIPGNGIVSFALIGSDAGPPSHGIGPNTCDDHGCNDGTLAQGWGSGTSDYPYLISVRKMCYKNNFNIYMINITDDIAQPLEAFQSVASDHHYTLDYFLDDWNVNAAAQVCYC
jgi:beta-glucosidase-like glycosyl hydrolase